VTNAADDEVTVRIPRRDYERIKQKAEKLATRSGRMSLRIPHALMKALDAAHKKTRRPKSQIVVDALRAALGNASVLE